ncbi:MAG: cobalamin B12-binding domain-containing protein [Hyphomicrobium sp.]
MSTGRDYGQPQRNVNSDRRKFHFTKFGAVALMLQQPDGAGRISVLSCSSADQNKKRNSGEEAVGSPLGPCRSFIFLSGRGCLAGREVPMPSSRQLLEVLEQWHSCESVTIDGERARASLRDRRRSQGENKKSTLTKTIETEIIPRLLLAHRPDSTRAEAGRGVRHSPSDEDVAEFTRLILDHEVRVGASYVEALREQGVSVETLFLELLAPSARLLGEMWKSDICDFTDVTIGLSRLQHIFHDLSPAFEDEAAEDFDGRRLLLVPVPGEQHGLGLMMVEEFFRRSGWDCCGGRPQSIDELSRMITSERFDVLGLSASCGVHLDVVAPLIKAARKSSRNPHMTVIVGGGLFNERPDLVSRVGADVTARDGREAVKKLRTTLGQGVKSLE